MDRRTGRDRRSVGAGDRSSVGECPDHARPDARGHAQALDRTPDEPGDRRADSAAGSVKARRRDDHQAGGRPVAHANAQSRGIPDVRDPQGVGDAASRRHGAGCRALSQREPSPGRTARDTRRMHGRDGGLGRTIRVGQRRWHRWRHRLARDHDQRRRAGSIGVGIRDRLGLVAGDGGDAPAGEECGCIRSAATRRARSSRTIPVNKSCPAFDVRTLHGCLAPSSATA